MIARRPYRQPPPRPARAAVCVVAAMAFLSSLLLSGWHEATTRHARCVEHGELVDVAGAPGAGPATHEATDASSDSTARVLATGAWSTEDDDHCTLCPSSAPPVTAPLAVTIALSLCAAEDASAPVERRACPPHGWLIRLAPKTSPPALRHA